MTDRELEERIRRAAERTVPDILDRILACCNDHDKDRSESVSSGVRALCTGRRAVSYRVILDVNPSISLEVDDKERVIRAEAQNGDARKLLADTDLNGMPLETAVNAVVGFMTREGYLSDIQNSILVSVESGGYGCADVSAGRNKQGDEQRENREIRQGRALQCKVSDIVVRAMEDSLNETEEGFSVLSQTVEEDYELSKMAGEFGISVGKAALISKLAGKNASPKTLENLASLSVNEIALLIQEGNMKDDTVTQTGRASDKAYIGQDGALKAAAAYAGVKNLKKVKKPKVKIDTVKGRMAYKVKFKTKSGKFKYLLDARTGEIAGCRKKGKNGKKYKYKKEGKKCRYKDKGNKCKYKKKGEKYKYKNKGRKYKYKDKVNGHKERSCDMSGKKKKNYKYYCDTGYTSVPLPEGAVGEQAAKAAALAHAGIPENRTLYVYCNPQIGHGPDHYDVKFVADGWKFKYAIGLYDGAVLGRAVKNKAEKGKYIYEGNYHEHYAPAGPGMSPCGTRPSEEAAVPSPTCEETPESPTSEETPVPASLCEEDRGSMPEGMNVPGAGLPAGEMIGEQQALETAIRKAGLTPADLIRWKLKMREKHGRLLYRFKLKVPGYEYEVDVDAYSGCVTKFHREYDY